MHDATQMWLFWGFWPLSARLHAAGGTLRHNGQRLQDRHLSSWHLPIYRIRWRGGAESLQEEEARTFTKYTDLVTLPCCCGKKCLAIANVWRFQEKLTCLSWMTEWGVFSETLCVFKQSSKSSARYSVTRIIGKCSEWWRRLHPNYKNVTSLFRRNWVT